MAVVTMLACDVSEWNAPVADSYPHRWLIFRACDGDYVDKKISVNLAWAVKARAAGKLDGFTVYVVYRPGKNDRIIHHLDGLGVPNDCHLMIDVESWGNEIHGDHSTEINVLAGALLNRQGYGSRVWGYANRNDYTTIWRSRPAWLGLVVASYGGSQPSSPGPGPLVGWQYTDGRTDVTGLPSTSAPFGPCDHNQLYITPGGPMAMDADVKAQFDALQTHLSNIDKRLTALFAVDVDGDGKPDITGTVQGAVKYALNPTALATAIASKLPAGSPGDLATITAAVKAALDGATIQTN